MTGAAYKTVTPGGVSAAILAANSKLAQNSSGSTISANSVCAFTNTGTLVLGVANTISATMFAGIAAQDIENTSFGPAIRTGNVVGALTGLNAVSGQAVFLSLTPGQLTLDTSGFTETDTLVRIGYAVPPDGSTGVANDLFIDFAVIPASTFLNGSPVSPQLITAEEGIVLTTITPFNIVWVEGSGGPVSVSAIPSITPGTTPGQVLQIIGISDINTVQLSDQNDLPGSGLTLNGDWICGQFNSLILLWDGYYWTETPRR